MTWDEIAIACGTDKASSRQGHIAHGYIAHYERLLAGRHIGAMVEVGIERGDSLRFWAQVFPGAEIIGMDKNPDYCCHEMPPNVRQFCGDASLATSWAAVPHHPFFDLIVDDGSHEIGHIRGTLKALVPELASDGLYVIEDTVGTLDWDWPAQTGEVCAAVLDAGLSIVEVAPSLYAFGAHGVTHGPQAMVVAAW